MGTGRKLEGIRQDLALIGEQGKTKGFFNNVENAEKLGGLVEDVRDAIMDYQVRIPLNSVLFVLKFLADVVAAGHIRQEFPTHSLFHPIPPQAWWLTSG